MRIFMSFNPHIENLSQTDLLKNFGNVLKKYYRKELGPRYYKHKNKQYPIGIFQEIGSTDFKQPHLHIIVDIMERPMEKMKAFYIFLKNGLSKNYPHLTADCQQIEKSQKDLENVFRYCLKEDRAIITNTDLYEKITPFNR